MEEVSQQERFDMLMDRVQSAADETYMGNFGRTLDMGQVAVRFLVFSPSEEQPTGYKPSILLQELIEKQGHNGRFWAPISEVYLREDKLDTAESAQKLENFETALDRFKEFLNSSAKIRG